MSRSFPTSHCWSTSPTSTAALAARTRLSHLLDGVIGREFALLGVQNSSPLPDHPCVWALAYRLRGARRSSGGGGEDVFAVRREAAESEGRARLSGCLAWEVDLAPAGGHLAESLERAVVSTPPPPGREAGLAEMAIADWRDERRRVFCAAACLLDEVWPEALAEMRVTVSQIVLIEGAGIDGFTDFMVHGAVFINVRRLAVAEGIAAEVHLAEALVHEGAHTAANAAAVARPMLRGGVRDGGPEVASPLRRDPRPLTALLQQLAVLIRSLVLHDRLAEHPLGGAATAARRDHLREAAHAALDTAQTHVADLAEPGLELLAGAEAVLGRAASVPLRG